LKILLAGCMQGDLVLQARPERLQQLGHTICRRPMYPLDPEVTFEPRPEIFHDVRR
jgi:hypothetical protein